MYVGWLSNLLFVEHSETTSVQSHGGRVEPSERTELLTWRLEAAVNRRLTCMQGLTDMMTGLAARKAAASMVPFQVCPRYWSTCARTRTPSVVPSRDK